MTATPTLAPVRFVRSRDGGRDLSLAVDLDAGSVVLEDGHAGVALSADELRWLMVAAAPAAIYALRRAR